MRDGETAPSKDREVRDGGIAPSKDRGARDGVNAPSKDQEGLKMEGLLYRGIEG